MVKLDIENRVFIDKDGHEIALYKRVLVSRTSGGYSPGWVLETRDYKKFPLSEDSLCYVILEEKSDIPNMAKYKSVCWGELFPCPEGVEF